MLGAYYYHAKALDRELFQCNKKAALFFSFSLLSRPLDNGLTDSRRRRWMRNGKRNGNAIPVTHRILYILLHLMVNLSAFSYRIIPWPQFNSPPPISSVSIWSVLILNSSASSRPFLVTALTCNVMYFIPLWLRWWAHRYTRRKSAIDGERNRGTERKNSGGRRRKDFQCDSLKIYRTN